MEELEIGEDAQAIEAVGTREGAHLTRGTKGVG